MVAGLLYAIGLIAVIVTIVMVGVAGPTLLQTFMAATEGPSPDYLAAVTRLGLSLSWVLWPLIGGLTIMGIGRIIFLLGAINRALRGTP